MPKYAHTHTHIKPTCLMCVYITVDGWYNDIIDSLLSMSVHAKTFVVTADIVCPLHIAHGIIV